MTDPFVEIEHVSRSFASTVALDDVSISVAEGEFVSLLGPSGCGKTTLLRIVAGFVRPDTGSVRIAGRTITHLPPNRRPTNLLFQRGALFPHMTVAENIGYALKRQHVRKDDVVRRVRDLLRLVRLPPAFEHRRPSQLSGGESQRVALARALAAEPLVLLLDEPLSALDLQLRKELQLELRKIHRELGTTFVFVTHDQEEALVMSDRILVMNSGQVVQDGTPREIYTNPVNRFACEFIGRTNLFQGVVERVDHSGHAHVLVGDARLLVSGYDGSVGETVILSIRPEAVERLPHGDAANTVAGVVTEVVFLGNRVTARVASQLNADLWIEDRTSAASNELRENGQILAALPTEAIRVFRDSA